MNPVFWLLLLLAAVLLWFCLSFLYRWIGRIVWRLWKDARDEIQQLEQDEEQEMRKGEEKHER